MSQLVTFAVLFAFLALIRAEEFPVEDSEAFEKVVSRVNAGDVIVLKNGIWKDSKLSLEASGTGEEPISIRAETPGKVVFTGDSRVALGGDYLVVEGLWFRNPTGTESIELRIGTRSPANHCRITNCAVTVDDPNHKVEKSSRFLSVYGEEHRIDHCYFAGKVNEGPTAVVWLADKEKVAHRFDHNHFGPRPRLGRNGGETIRIGDSKTSMMEAACLVEHNLFEKCDGEAECISNKSCGNRYRNNRFISVSGTLTLRHGNNCIVENNLFDGKGAKGTGGVRVIGEGHVVKGNRFQNLTGDDERSALCLMMGIPDSPANGYFQVKGARISGNTFLNCEHNILIGMKGHSEAKQPPLDTIISGNVIQTNKGRAYEILCDDKGVKLERNKTGKDLEFPAEPSKPEASGPEWWGE